MTLITAQRGKNVIERKQKGHSRMEKSRKVQK